MTRLLSSDSREDEKIKRVRTGRSRERTENRSISGTSSEDEREDNQELESSQEV